MNHDNNTQFEQEEKIEYENHTGDEMEEIEEVNDYMNTEQYNKSCVDGIIRKGISYMESGASKLTELYLQGGVFYTMVKIFMFVMTIGAIISRIFSDLTLLSLLNLHGDYENDDIYPRGGGYALPYRIPSYLHFMTPFFSLLWFIHQMILDAFVFIINLISPFLFLACISIIVVFIAVFLTYPLYIASECCDTECDDDNEKKNQ